MSKHDFITVIKFVVLFLHRIHLLSQVLSPLFVDSLLIFWNDLGHIDCLLLVFILFVNLSQFLNSDFTQRKLFFE